MLGIFHRDIIEQMKLMTPNLYNIDELLKKKTTKQLRAEQISDSAEKTNRK